MKVIITVILLLSLAGIIYLSLNNLSLKNTGATVSINSIHQTTFKDSLTKIEMDLSVFGVESDNFPSIQVMIDFSHDTSVCVKTYYNPAYKGSSYTLSKNEMISIKKLLKISDLAKLKYNYTANLSDQPTSTIKIHTVQNTFVIKDYGLEGDYPLKELYKIVYRYEFTI